MYRLFLCNSTSEYYPCVVCIVKVTPSLIEKILDIQNEVQRLNAEDSYYGVNYIAITSPLRSTDVSFAVYDSDLFTNGVPTTMEEKEVVQLLNNKDNNDFYYHNPNIKVFGHSIILSTYLDTISDEVTELYTNEANILDTLIDTLPTKIPNVIYSGFFVLHNLEGKHVYHQWLCKNLTEMVSYCKKELNIIIDTFKEDTYTKEGKISEGEEYRLVITKLSNYSLNQIKSYVTNESTTKN